MKTKQVPVEINMLSNEFILGIKNDFHPFLLYHNSGVPIVITMTIWECFGQALPSNLLY